MFNLNPSCCNLRPLRLVECKWRTAAHAHRLTSAISQDDPVRQARVIRPNLVLSKYVFIPVCMGRRLVCWARARAASLSGGLFRGLSPDAWVTRRPPDAWLPLSVLLYGAPRPRRHSKLEMTHPRSFQMQLSGSSRDLDVALFRGSRFNWRSWGCSTRVYGFPAPPRGQGQGKGEGRGVSETTRRLSWPCVLSERRPG